MMAAVKCKNFFDARSLALHVLMQNHKGVSLQQSLDLALSQQNFIPQDVSLCTELVYGYSRFFLRVDFILDCLLKNRLALPKLLQLTLGMSVYSLFFLTKVPHYATVSWAVDFVKAKFGLKLSKLCNGVLRSVMRLENKPHEISFYNNPHEFYSVPQWIYELWLNSYGKENCESLLSRSLQRPKSSLRLNPKHERYNDLFSFFSSLDYIQAIGFDGFVSLEGNFPSLAAGFSLQTLHDSGAFSWQSAGSQVVMHEAFNAIPELKDECWWDACAGQGGKSLMLLEQNINVSLVSDISKSRLKQFKCNANRLKINFSSLVEMSARQACLRNFTYSIILDVPCSGLGTLAKRPDIRLNRKLEHLDYLIQTQSSILQSCFNILQVNKFLVYITCTLNPSENELMIKNFLNDNRACEEVFSWCTPHLHPWLEGMFVSVVKKVF